jgi:hypothetical protein
MQLQGGDGDAGVPRLAQSRGNCPVVGQWLLDIELASRGRQLAPLPRLASVHEPGSRDLPVGLALAHAQLGLSAVMHRQSLTCHP